MKKLFLVMIVLGSLTVQGQEYFSREYNKAIFPYEDKEIDMSVKVEFNVFQSTDILVRMGDEEPVRYVQVGDIVDERPLVPFQLVRMKLAGTGSYFEFAIYDDGDLVIVNEQTDGKVWFTNS